MKDEKWLNSQFPFRLVPTNLDDVYTTAPLPGNLDLKTATSSTLWQHGLPFHRPEAGDKQSLPGSGIKSPNEACRSLPHM